jgi:hypothetical protein
MPSWTASPEVAAWFAVFWAKRLDTSGPAVFRLEVAKDDVFFYTNDRKEEEFVIDVRSDAAPERLDSLPVPQLPGQDPLPWPE